MAPPLAGCHTSTFQIHPVVDSTELLNFKISHMRHYPLYLTFLLHCLLLVGCTLLSGLNVTDEVFIERRGDGRYCWGRLSPGSRLVCTKRRFVFDSGKGSLHTRPFDPLTPYDEGNEGAPYRVAMELRPGDVLVARRLSEESMGTHGFTTLYCTAPTGEEIAIGFPMFGPRDEPFSADLMRRVGFDVQTSDGKAISGVPWHQPPPRAVPADARIWRH